MAILLEQLIQNIADSGLMPADEVRSCIDTIPADSRPQDGESLAHELTAQGRLTAYQAEALCRGETAGLVFDEYVVLEKIGQGGMGVVLKAKQRRMDRFVAVKRLTIEHIEDQDEDAVQRFDREVKALAKMSHPNIVTAYDCREQGGVRYLVLEYVEGSDLAAIVNKEGPLPVERAVDYIIQAARGLGFAHKRGITHRDIKPANLLVDEEGIVKVLDMGLARIEEVAAGGDAPTIEHLTSHDQVMGTCDYMSPEQADGAGHVDHRSDIYSLGCTLYRLLTGDLPYTGSSSLMILMAHREKDIPSLIDKRPEVTPELEAVYRKMMAKEPDDRYQTMQEVVGALEATRRGETPSDSVIDVPPADEELSSFLDHIRDDPSSVSAIGKRAGMSGIGTRAGMPGTIGKKSGRSGVRKRADKKSDEAVAASRESTAKAGDETRPEIPPEAAKPGAEEGKVAPTAQPERESHRTIKRQRRKQRRVMLWIGVAVAASLLGVAAVVGVLVTQTSYGTVVVDSDESNFRLLIKVDGETITTIDAQQSRQATVKPGQYALELVTDDDGLKLDKETIVVTRGDEVRLKVTAQAAGPGREVALKPGEWVDLLYHLDLKEDARQGKWKLNDGCLSINWDDPNSSYGTGLLRLPVRLPESFELRIVADQMAGDSIYLPGPAGHGQCLFAGDGTSLIARQTGFDRAIHSTAKSMGDGEERHVHISFVTDGKGVAITAKGDGNEYFDWEGTVEKLNLLAGDPVAAGAIVLANDGSPARYRQIQICVPGTDSSILRPVVAAAATDTQEDGALLFGHSWNWVRTPVVYDGSHPITVEAWVESRSEVDRLQHIVADAGGGGPFALQVMPGGFFHVALGNPRDEWSTATNEWSSLYEHFHHVAAVFDGRHMHLYVDGRQRGSFELADVGKNAFKCPLTIGATPLSQTEVAEGKECFAGLIDEVRISSTARYKKDFRPAERFEPDKDTMALYHFDEVAGTVARDASEHKRHGTIFGAKHVALNPPVPRTRALLYPPNASEPLPNGWEVREPVHLGSEINHPGDDHGPFLTEDGLTLLFGSNRPEGGQGEHDIWKCTRRSPKEPFGEPVNLGPPINGPKWDSLPVLSADGLTLVFASSRPGRGNHDLWMCTRKSPDADFDEPVNLEKINSGNRDTAPSLSADGLTLLFHSDRSGGEEGDDIWMSQRPSLSEPFEKPKNLGPIVNSPYADAWPSLSADGCTLLFGSSRRGGRGKMDVWMCTRPSALERFGPPINLGSPINTAAWEGAPSFSEKSRTLFFSSEREGGLGKGDLWQAEIIVAAPGKKSAGPKPPDAGDEGTPPPGEDAAAPDVVPESEPPQDAPAAGDDDLTSERDIAGWALKLGDSVRVQVVSESTDEKIGDPKDLPDGPIELVFLSLAGTLLADDDLQRLSRLSHLQELHLNDTDITDAGIVHLGQIRSLERMNLGNTKVGDAALATLAKLPELSTLSVRDTAVTDMGIQHLMGKQSLKGIDLRGTQVTADGVEALRKALPDCRVLPEP